MQARVETLTALIFGAKSEKASVIDPEQGLLDLGDLALEAAPAANDNADRTLGQPKRPPRRPAHRNVGALPRHLPRLETTIEPESTACPCCAGAMHRIGEDVAEALDVIPAVVRVLRTTGVPRSAGRRANAICSSVNFDFLIDKISPLQVSNLAGKLAFCLEGFSGRGAGSARPAIPLPPIRRLEGAPWL